MKKWFVIILLLVGKAAVADVQQLQKQIKQIEKEEKEAQTDWFQAKLKGSKDADETYAKKVIESRRAIFKLREQIKNLKAQQQVPTLERSTTM